MSDFERLERRLAAVERALTESERPVSDVPERAAIADDIDRLQEQIDGLVARVAELEGGTQALRGYVGNVRSVNESVERRADAAVATVDRLERRVETLEGPTAEPNTTALSPNVNPQNGDPPKTNSQNNDPPKDNPQNDDPTENTADDSTGSTTDSPSTLEESEREAGTERSFRRSQATDGGEVVPREPRSTTQRTRVIDDAGTVDPGAVDQQRIEDELATLSTAQRTAKTRDSTETTAVATTESTTGGEESTTGGESVADDESSSPADGGLLDTIRRVFS